MLKITLLVCLKDSETLLSIYSQGARAKHEIFSTCLARSFVMFDSEPIKVQSVLRAESGKRKILISTPFEAARLCLRNLAF